MIDLDNTKLDLDNIKTQQELDVALDTFSDTFTYYWEGCSISKHGRSVFSPYLMALGLSDCLDALDIAYRRMETPENTYRYTIGILKNWVKDGKPSYSMIDKVGGK